MKGATMILALVAPQALLSASAPAQPIDLGNRRELFVDRYLIGSLTGARLVMHTPQPVPPPARPLPRTWDGSMVPAWSSGEVRPVCEFRSTFSI